MHVLCVAEKPSIAKSITQILSGGQSTTRNTQCNYIKNYDFQYPQTRSTFTVTAVAGHILSHEFSDAFRKWDSCDPLSLYDAPIVSFVKKEAEPMKRNLVSEARKAQTLMIWTDCDREGEHIGTEIVQICREAKRNITVKRARFSAIIAQQIHNAAQHPVELDWNQASAVDARIELDLRIGASFTRLQTKRLQTAFNQLKDVMSYGPCQFPTLGFVVERYTKVKSFRPEPFWYIYLSLAARGSEVEEVPFTWRRGHIFHQAIVDSLYMQVMASERARVVRVTQKETKKWKPLPLTTVELQKAGSRILKISPKRVLDIAESLYQQGFLSYPRTETDQYDPQFDFASLIEKQVADPGWGAFATSLQNGGFQQPRRGKKNDNAHPPIHPTAHAGNVTADDKRVYEYITRRFLASCSKDAIGMETTVEVEYGGEYFSTTGLIVLERNYLDVFPYDKWSSKELPELREGQEFTPHTCEARQGETSPPTLLTEADLVAEMDKNGIGTDATIAQHIATIIERKYVIEHMRGNTKYLVPSNLGVGLVEGYNAIDYDKSLSKPQLRRDTERDMMSVCEGRKTKNQMIQENIERYREMFAKTRAEMQRILNSVRDRLSGGDVGYDLDFADGAFGGGGDDGAGGGGRERGRGGRGTRGVGRGGRGGGGSAPSSRRGRGGGGGAAWGAVNRGADDDDDDDPPPPPPGPPAARPRRPPNSEANARPRSAFSRVACDCGVPASENETNGRRYWGCGNNGGCQYFQFMSGLARPAASNSAATSAHKQCQCSKDAVLFVTKSGQNIGKKFWRCPNPVDSKCGFFEWAINDEVEGIPVANAGSTAPRSTNYSNESSRAASGGGSSSSRPSGDRPCFKCNQVGHWAADCPQAGGSSSQATHGAASGSGSRACFKCGQEGHFSSACPNGGTGGAPKPKSYGGGGGGGSSNMSCFKCGEEGHFSNACPNNGAGGSNYKPQSNGAAVCYKCQQPGHYSNACPNNGAGAPKRSNSSSSRGRAKRARSRARSTTNSRGRGRKKAKTAEASGEDMDDSDGLGFDAW